MLMFDYGGGGVKAMIMVIKSKVFSLKSLNWLTYI